MSIKTKLVTVFVTLILMGITLVAICLDRISRVNAILQETVERRYQIVHLTHERIHETDCDECFDQPRRLDRITVALELTGALTEEQRDRLRQIAARCPVHKTLTSNISIQIR